MMSLLFLSYVLFAPGNPTASYFAHRQPVALIPYIPRTLACCKASQFRLRSDATRPVLEPFLWCHPRKQNGHTRHLVATKVGAVVFATSRRNDMACGRGMEPDATTAAHPRPRQHDQPARATCGGLALPRAVRQVGSAGRQSPLNPDTHGCRSSDRAGRCCVHRPGRGRGGRREGE